MTMHQHAGIIGTVASASLPSSRIALPSVSRPTVGPEAFGDGCEAGIAVTVASGGLQHSSFNPRPTTYDRNVAGTERHRANPYPVRFTPVESACQANFLQAS